MFVRHIMHLGVLFFPSFPFSFFANPCPDSGETTVFCYHKNIRLQISDINEQVVFLPKPDENILNNFLGLLAVFYDTKSMLRNPILIAIVKFGESFLITFRYLSS